MLVTWKQLREFTPALCLLALEALAGSVVMQVWQADAPKVELPPIDLHASGASSNDAFAICTGMIDEQVEGVFMLDFLTGDLQCLVLNPRTGKFNGQFAINVIKVLGVDQQKKPRYLMVTGSVGWIGMAGITRPASAVCYVVDANTGAYAALGLPWNFTKAQAGVPQGGTFNVLGFGRARNVAITE